MSQYSYSKIQVCTPTVGNPLLNTIQSFSCICFETHFALGFTLVAPGTACDSAEQAGSGGAPKRHERLSEKPDEKLSELLDVQDNVVEDSA